MSFIEPVLFTSESVTEGHPDKIADQISDAILDAALANLSRWAFLLTFAGVGLRMNLRQLFRQGARPIVVGALGEFLIAFLTLGLVVGANAVWGI